MSEPPTATQSTPTSPAATTQAEPQSPQTIRRVPPPRTGPAPLYNHALNQALPSGSQSSQKRTASARSPSPTQGPNKSRRTDVPTGPRAMQRDRDGGRSLLDRMGGRQRGVQGAQVRDEIQARIDAVTHGGGVPPQEMMGGPMNGFNNGMAPAMMPMMPGPDMSAMMNSMNPMALQELMMNQMALMAQMANNIGILNAQQGQLLQQQQQQKPQPGPGAHQGDGNRRGGGPSGRGRGRGGAWTGGSTTHVQQDNASTSPAATTSTTPSELNPTAPVFTPSASTSSPAQQPGISPPSRPQSPTLCKFGAKCVNALCRYSHPSPVATTESGVVLSNDACENGKNCKDKDCIKAHVSPAAVGVSKVAGACAIIFRLTMFTLLIPPVILQALLINQKHPRYRPPFMHPYLNNTHINNTSYKFLAGTALTASNKMPDVHISTLRRRISLLHANSGLLAHGRTVHSNIPLVVYFRIHSTVDWGQIRRTSLCMRRRLGVLVGA